MQAAGWTWRGITSWHKPDSRPQKGRLKQFREYIVCGTKGQVDANPNPVYLPGLYSASQLRKDRVHITQKPVDVMQELVKTCPPGRTVRGSFTGSGTTGVAALREGANSSASNSPTATEYETGPFFLQSPPDSTLRWIRPAAWSGSRPRSSSGFGSEGMSSAAEAALTT